MYRVRAVLECEAARFVTERPDRLTPLDDAVTRMWAVPAGAGWGTTMEAHLEFHLALVDAAGSPRLSRATARSGRRHGSGGPSQDELPDLATPEGQAANHEDLLAVFRMGDPDRSAAAVREHMQPGLDAAIESERASDAGAHAAPISSA